MYRLIVPVALAIGAVLVAGYARGHDKPHQAAAQNELKQFGGPLKALPRASGLTDEVPLWELGGLSYPVTTASAEAQRYFDQGLMLAYGFNHAEARRSFQAAQRLDPSCAMCFWGEALVLGPNINAPMDASASAPALAAIGKAMALARAAGAREQALIEALSRRYSADPKAERATLDLAYADAMRAVAGRFPFDLDPATLYAESVMNLSPWDYWEAGGARPKGRTAELVATLERVLGANPDHPGAIHLYIHAVEASDRPARAEPYADRLARQKLETGHLVHMPSHIYYRVGRYRDSLEINRAAVAADEAFLAKVTTGGIYGGAYYPHNVHFLMVSAQMAGDGPTVIAAAEKLGRTVSDEAARTIPWVQPIKAAPFYAYAQFGTARTVLDLQAPSADLPFVQAMWHYARGVAHAALKDTASARGEADAIAAIAERADFSALSAGGIPASDLLALAREVVLARIAQGEGDLRAAVGRFEAAVLIEDRLSYMEPPHWYYPVRQSLGAALLMAGRPEEAERAFRESLKRAPNNGWALFGLAEALKARGSAAEAVEVSRRLDRSWAGEREMLDLARL